MSQSEIQQHADFSTIRYAQCWEDSKLLTAALKPNNRHCLSIGSAGDNSFALLASGAESVTAVEMNAAQVACIHLRRAAYLKIEHGEFLELLGSRASSQRAALYRACRSELPPQVQEFWDARPLLIAAGIGSAGKFERYFKLFRDWVLPLAHPRQRVLSLLEPRTPASRLIFYDRFWNNRRWRWIFKVFFSRQLMGILGRDPAFFAYVEGSVAEKILARTRHAFVMLDPACNPYLRWILCGTHAEALPEALEHDHFGKIRSSLLEDRLIIEQSSLEDHLQNHTSRRYDAFNLSDIFEYMSEENTADLLKKLVLAANPGARMAYWNMLVPRSRPDELAHRLQPCSAEAQALYAEDRAFFYSRFVVEEVIT
jgi:S-adenosylmethionine-diacylglycerol 3-amino-3-carboxypropyl transferase